MIKNQQTRFAANLQTWRGSCLQVDRLCFVKTVVEMCPDLKLEQALSNGTEEQPMWLGQEEGGRGRGGGIKPLIGGNCQKYHICIKNIFVVTKLSSKLSAYFVTTNTCLLRLKFCHDKHTFIMTKDRCYLRQTRVCCDKVSETFWRKFSCDKNIFEAGVKRRILSRQKWYL